MMKVRVSLLLLLWCGTFFQGTSAELVRVDLSSHKAWRLTSANNSIDVPATIPAHTLSVLASAGLIAQDPLHRHGERDTAWVGEERWNFTLVWSSKKHAELVGCKQVLLVLHGIDTIGTVVLNGRHVLQADNAHRSWWLPLSDPEALREGANMLSIVLHPAAQQAARAKAAYPYPVPTMQVPGAINVYNFIRKPAFGFGWDWGPAFVPVGITGGVELVGFDRATLIGALVTQQFNSSSKMFELTVTAQFLVPAAGDNGTLSVTLAVLDVHEEQQVILTPGVVGGNRLQALVTMQLQLTASKVTLWQPLTLAPKGKSRQLYDLAVMFEPTPSPQPTSQLAGTCGVGDSSTPPPDIRSTIVRRVGFRTVELVQQPVQAAAEELLGHQGHAHTHGLQSPQLVQDGVGADTTSSSRPLAGSSAPAHQDTQGESFYFKVNGVPLFAKGANLIPLHVLSTAVTPADVRGLLQSAVDANMNMIRIWGGGMYQVDELYEAADELGLMVWQEAMFACSPYPRNAAFLSNVEAEVTQQVLRLGSHASLVVFGGNNEVEQSLEWYPDTLANVPMYTTDYHSMFVHTIGRKVQQMLPYTPWVDSSPSKGVIKVPDMAQLTAEEAPAGHVPAGVEGSLLPSAVRAGHESQATGPRHDVIVKRWGNTNDPAYGDVHFYDYINDCQDWRTYPHARFVSEYGWQSYPTWSTYAAATTGDDWQVAADMTEYRQRHPNGTVELLAQLQRRFKLPQAWMDLLPQQQLQQGPGHDALQQQVEHHQHSAPQAATTSTTQTSPVDASVAVRVWHGLMQCACRMMAALRVRLGLPLLPGCGMQSSSRTEAHVSTPSARGLTVGTAHSDEGTASRSGGAFRHSNNAQRYNDMQHYIYLTQLQQMLCYETALHHWRRLRSDASTLSMGVLYWQLNDVWAGASWSSIDYGGVWKPVHYGVARAFADVSLSVQHDLQEDTIKVFAVNDLQQLAKLQLAVRVLSVADTPADCPGTHSADSSNSQPAGAAGSNHIVFSSAPYVRHHTSTQAEVPAAAAALLWSSSVDSLLRKAGRGCSRSSCYVHISLAGQQQQQQQQPPPPQEATVWLAPFKDIPLQDPQLLVTPLQPGHPQPAGSTATAPDSDVGAAGVISFKVSSQAVAVYAVWEVQGGTVGPVAGHFTDNALTVHPCEPREVGFIPRGTRGAGRQSSGAPAAGDGRESEHGSTSRSSDSNNHSPPVVMAGTGSSKGVLPHTQSVSAGVSRKVDTPGADAAALLQEQVVVSSLWDHQQFDQQRLEGERIATV